MNPLYKTSHQGPGRYDVIYETFRPRRIGFITGGRGTWLAERGPVTLGYFKSKKLALEAIVKEFNRSHTEENPIPLSLI